jgi:hypothetical protein
MEFDSDGMYEEDDAIALPDGDVAYVKGGEMKVWPDGRVEQTVFVMEKDDPFADIPRD